MRSRFKVAGIAVALAVCLVAPARSAASEPLHYYGGEIASQPHVYLTFWGQKWNEYSTARTEVREMFAHLSSSAWEGVLTQYFGHAGFVSSEVGLSWWTDESVSAPTVTYPALEHEVEEVKSKQGWPAGVNSLYLVLPVPGSVYHQTTELGFSCGSHQFLSSLGTPWAFVGMPVFTAGESLPKICLEADPSGQNMVGRALSAVASHEFAELVTDPIVPANGGAGSGWARPGASSPEIADVCSSAPGGQLSNGSWVVSLWDNYLGYCTTSDPAPLSATQTEVEATALNGNPGWLTVKGHVFAGVAVNNKYVNVNLKKWENGQWVLKATLQPTVNNSAFEVSNWNGVGKGEWIARVVFPQQAPFAESSSDEGKEGHFTVKDGYRLVARHSAKCLDVYGAYTANGTGMIQYECGNPVTSQNQVFTLVPLGNAYYELVARHSGRCVDVTNASQSDGARLQQWSCNGFQQQQWQGVPYGPTGYSHFVAKHSGKCMDVEGASQNNIAAVNQWTCGGGTNQQWTLQSVESAAIPTHSSLTVNSTLNGQPGFINVSGNIDAGAYSLGGQTVNVNFQRETSPGNWQTVENETLHVNLNGENHYAWETWAIGVGQWRTRVVYPGNTPYAGSESEYHYFQIKSGYRLINRYSNKCMSLSANSGTNGTGIIQWDCSGNPSPGDGQVFTLVPMGGNYYEIKINSTGKCVDVTNVSTADGAWLQEWDCLGPNQANQLWQNVELANQPGWFAFIAKHSGKCADLTGPSSNNGVRIQQWSCHWGSNQQWRFEAIN